MAYAVLGWTVGLQFNKAIFLLALKTLPQIIASIIGLILMCALMALALTHILQMDFMTAYLATSPGGWTRWRLSPPAPGRTCRLLWRYRRCGCLPFC